MAKKYACYMEEEEDPSVVGQGMLTRREVPRWPGASRLRLARKERRAILTSGMPSDFLEGKMAIRPGLTGCTQARIQ